jgi:hypothetical protein
MEGEEAKPVHHASHPGKIARLTKFILSHKIYALAAVIYLVIALINFWPVTTHITSTVAGIGGDAYQFMWDIWFVGYSLFTLHQGIWHTTLLFWPIGASLIYQTSIPIASLLVTPFTAVSLPFAFNLIFFAGFCLSGLTMFILARYLTKNSYAAFIAGLIFTFSSFHIAQAYGHVEYTNIEWIPLALYFFLRIVREDQHRLRKALAVAICMVLTCFMVDVETGIILMSLLAVITIIYLIVKETRSRILSRSFLKAIGVFIVATFILGSWAWIPIAGSIIHSGTGGLNSLSDLGHNAIWSDDLLSFFIPNPYNGILGGLFSGQSYIYHGDISETAAYLTYTAIILALLGLWKHFKENRLWLVLGVIAVVLALGPVLLVNTTLPATIGSGTGVSGVPLPYQIVRMIPVLSALREPGRFDMVVTIALAIMAAYGVKYLTDLKEGHHHLQGLNMKAIGVIVIISLLFLVESNGISLSASAVNATTTHVAIPQAYYELAPLQGNFSVLQLPIIPDPVSSQPQLYAGKAMFYQTVSHKPIVGGYATRENTTQQLSVYQIPLAIEATSMLDYGQLLYESPVAENYTNQTLLSLYNYQVGLVTLDKTAYNQSELQQMGDYLYSVFGSPVYNDNTTTIFSTQNAITQSLYRSYVAYPVLSDWNQSVSFVNGSYVQEWEPVGLGAVSVFAPYANQSNLYNTLYHKQLYYANTIVSFEASSPVPQKLYLGTPTSSTNYSVIGYYNITAGMHEYAFNVSLVSGPVGNTFFFLPQYTNYPTKIVNITFTRGG